MSKLNTNNVQSQQHTVALFIAAGRHHSWRMWTSRAGQHLKTDQNVFWIWSLLNHSMLNESTNHACFSPWSTESVDLFPAGLLEIQKPTGMIFALRSTPQQIRNTGSWEPWYMTNPTDSSLNTELPHFCFTVVMTTDTNTPSYLQHFSFHIPDRLWWVISAETLKTRQSSLKSNLEVKHLHKLHHTCLSQPFFQDSEHGQHRDQRCQGLTFFRTDFWANRLKQQLAADTTQCCHRHVNM